MSGDGRYSLKKTMGKFFCPWPSVHNVLIFIAVVFLLSLAGLSATEWASWVQAVGSVAAIVGATYIAGEQRRQKIEDEAKEKEEYARKAYGVAELCVGLIERVSKCAYSSLYNPQELLPRAIATLSDCQFMLSSVDALRFESPEHTEAFAKIRFNASIVKGLWEQIVAGGDYNEHLNEMNLQCSVKECEDSLRKLRTDLFPMRIV